VSARRFSLRYAKLPRDKFRFIVATIPNIFYLLTNPVNVFLCKDLARRKIETRTTKVFSNRKILTTELIDVSGLNVYWDEE
jgi:hypothetical protein